MVSLAPTLGMFPFPAFISLPTTLWIIPILCHCGMHGCHLPLLWPSSFHLSYFHTRSCLLGGNGLVDLGKAHFERLIFQFPKVIRKTGRIIEYDNRQSYPDHHFHSDNAIELMSKIECVIRHGLQFDKNFSRDVCGYVKISIINYDSTQGTSCSGNNSEKDFFRSSDGNHSSTIHGRGNVALCAPLAWIWWVLLTTVAVAAASTVPITKLITIMKTVTLTNSPTLLLIPSHDNVTAWHHSRGRNASLYGDWSGNLFLVSRQWS